MGSAFLSHPELIYKKEQPMNIMTESPFHSGEHEIQQRFGVRERMERFGRQVIHDHMPEQYRDFYAQLPFVFVAHADHKGWPWASMLFNKAGFISSKNNQQLYINAVPVKDDPLTKSLETGTQLGLVGIELETRRRNRLSTTINQISEKGIDLTVKQAFGNCPQYIQTRELEVIDPQSMPPVETKKLTQFDQQAIELISNSDTFFVASYIDNVSDAVSEGADVSHRGGKPGFIRVDGFHQLTIPDYIGNNHFNTLGNFQENAKAGLLFIDFIKGHMLTLTGTVEILWDSDEAEFFSGAERLWQFKLDHGYWLKNSLPLRWKFQEYSPNTSLTGNWNEAKASQQADQLKHSWQPYQVINIVEESSVVKSFYLQPPADQKPLYQAGQFLTLKSEIDGKEQIRNYTVSSAPHDAYLRISVKRDGIFSKFLHQNIGLGDVIDCKAPSGIFTIDTTNNIPAVLISAGIGITPMVSMVRHVMQEGIRTRSIRPVIMICVVRNALERAFYNELNEITSHSTEQIQVIWVLTQAESHLKIGEDYHYAERLNKQMLQSILPETICDVYLCGPEGFMQDQYNWLRELGLGNDNIFSEAFGPASLIRDDENTVFDDQLPVAKDAIITFTESQFEQAWSAGDGNLLDFVEAHGLNPDYGCRSGKCGTCKQTLISGKVHYLQPVDLQLKTDEILLCCSVPAAEEGKDSSELKIKL